MVLEREEEGETEERDGMGMKERKKDKRWSGEEDFGELERMKLDEGRRGSLLPQINIIIECDLDYLLV